MSNALALFAERLNAAKARIALGKSAQVAKPSAVTPEACGVPSSSDNPLADRGNATKYRVTSSIPAGARVAGDLLLEESAIIGGQIDGRLSIQGKGMAAFIKPGGIVRGGVTASIVLIYGEVYGKIEAEYVRIYAGGRVEGIIHAESMLVDKGGCLVNEHMRIAPPISATSKAPIDVRPMIRPATASEVRSLADAVASVRQGI